MWVPVYYYKITPVALVSDRGKEVDGQLMREACRLMNVDKVRTTAYKASTNVAVERLGP